ncbi:MAG: hypothetical protein OXB89_04295 [Anaerolineaceae bacterium]|nr:hypothetical protein [Anaerolineaceae bacterium]
MDADAARSFYLNEVWPRLQDEARARLRERWPRVRLEPAPGYLPLAELPLRMLCGLTGSGKSTALAALRESGRWRYCDELPSRRDLADLVIIPVAQVHRGAAIAPVRDRGERFRWTQVFAQEICRGGSAAAFSWLYYRHDGQTALLSEGLRGAREIGAALRRFPRWRIVELWLDPLTRLQRLSGRNDAFDALANGDADLGHLPVALRAEARQLLAAGKISRRALAIAAAEAKNYGERPWPGEAANYRCLRMEQLTPEAAALAVGEFLFAGEAT